MPVRKNFNDDPNWPGFHRSRTILMMKPAATKMRRKKMYPKKRSWHLRKKSHDDRVKKYFCCFYRTLTSIIHIRSSIFSNFANKWRFENLCFSQSFSLVCKWSDGNFCFSTYSLRIHELFLFCWASRSSGYFQDFGTLKMSGVSFSLSEGSFAKIPIPIIYYPLYVLFILVFTPVLKDTFVFVE